jgi:hypothetical protein
MASPIAATRKPSCPQDPEHAPDFGRHRRKFARADAPLAAFLIANGGIRNGANPFKTKDRTPC